MTSLIEEARSNGDFPTCLTFNFLAMAYGQDAPLTEPTMQFVENTLDSTKMEHFVVHLATNLKVPGHTVFWTKTFVEKLFHSSGAVYQACGFYSLANGTGTLHKRYRQSPLLDEDLLFNKVYNTLFKKIKRMIQDFHQGFSEELLLHEPNMAKVLAYQPFGLPSACKKNKNLTKIAKDFEDGLQIKILEHRLQVLEELDSLHSGRVEFVCSLIDTSIRELARKYTGRSVFQILDYLSGNNEIGPLVSLSRHGISTYLIGLLTALLKPIKTAFQHFFVEKRPVSPDVLETVHICECFISYILNGTKNYFPTLANIGLNLNRYKDVNGVTLAHTAMISQTKVFRVDASANTAGTVYTIAFPSIRRRSIEDDFTRELSMIHRQLKLNKYSLAETVLVKTMEIIVEFAFSQFNPDPLNIFGKAFVESLPNPIIQMERLSVSTVVGLILEFTFSDLVINVIETAIETMGDLEADPSSSDIQTVGKASLNSALNTVLILALKGKIMLDCTYYPVIGRRFAFRRIVPDLCSVMKDGNPPLFHPVLAMNVLSNAAAMMGRLNPFPDRMGSLQPPVMYLLYKLLHANVRQVTKALHMLGGAMTLLINGFTQPLVDSLENKNISFRDMTEAGLCAKISRVGWAVAVDEHFRFHFYPFIDNKEKEFIVAHNNLSASGLNRLHMT